MSSMPKGSRWENWYPTVLSAPVGLLYYLLWYSWLPDTTKDLMAAVVSVASIAVGFIATTKSILVSLEGRHIIRTLRRTGAYDRLLAFMMTAVKACFALAVMSLAGIVMRPNYRPYQHILFAGWLSLLSFAGLACYRVIDLFGQLLRVPEPPVAKRKEVPGPAAPPPPDQKAA